MKKILLFVIVCLAVLLVGSFIWFYVTENSALTRITDFETCKNNGYPIMESYPRQCRTPDGRMFVEKITNTPTTPDVLIRVTSPAPGTEITSPLVITGEAKGNWYFEASFPVKLVGSDEKLIAQGVATAQGDWMTENFVPFTATLTFKDLKVATGTLVLQRDNPSGLPQNDAEFRIPVVFAK